LAEPSAPPLPLEPLEILSPLGKIMPRDWAGTGDEYDLFMDSNAPPSPGSTSAPGGGWIGGATRCAHCHRRLRRTKRKKNSKR
jgi:hypothetical protein